jgi:glycerol-1-phosphate dehydrogenase [NAD(P)+]
VVNDYYEVEVPQHVILGSNILEEGLKKIDIFKGINTALVVTGPTKTREYGEIVKNILTDMNIKVFTYSLNNFLEKTQYKYIDEVKSISNIATQNSIKIILGVAGGKVFDIVKVCSELLSIPYISIPTTASHDGISSPVISYPIFEVISSKIPLKSSRVRPPVAILADTAIASRSDKKLLYAGCGDLTAKFTAVLDWKLAHKRVGEKFNEYAAALSMLGFKIIKNRRRIISLATEESYRVVLKALIAVGVAAGFVSSSRPLSGSEHIFSHTLEMLSHKYGFKPALHGEQCGVGTIIMTYLHGKNWRLIKSILREIGAPTNADELGIEEKYLIEALITSRKTRPERYTILNERSISYEEARKILHEVEVI